METKKAQDLADQAKKDYQSGNLPAAIRGFEQAAAGFAGEGDARMAAEMMNNLSVSLLRNKQAQPALDAVLGTDMVFEKAGDFRLQGMALANQASAWLSTGHPGEARQAFKLAAEALEKAGEKEYRLQVLQQLSVLYLRQFKFMDAILALQSGLAGLDHPTPRQRFMKKILFIRL